MNVPAAYDTYFMIPTSCDTYFTYILEKKLPSLIVQQYRPSSAFHSSLETVISQNLIRAQSGLSAEMYTVSKIELYKLL